MSRYRGGGARWSSCSFVSAYWVGKVMQIVMPPAWPPTETGDPGPETSPFGFLAFPLNAAGWYLQETLPGSEENDTRVIAGERKEMQGENLTIWSFFFLEGFSRYPKLEIVLFIFSLVMYLVTLLGNSTLILISILDSRLQTPMYLFLGNLSFMDICYTSASIPTLLVNLLSSQKTIIFSGCAVQMYLSLAMGSTECVLLAVMAYDRYVAICNPLRYPIIMNRQVCIQMATVSWVTGCLTALLETSFALQIPLCGNLIDHFTCEILAVLKLACASSLLMDMILLVVSVLLLPIPMLLICISYVFILSTILRISSVEGRNKAFSTCGAHLTVVVLYYGAALSMYLKPSSSSSQQVDKIISLLYGVLTPMLNPIIYSLRNKEVKDAMKKLLGKISLHQT
ncbi:Olfactory receptor 2K2 [Pteropus alecto]|uniref:Olfactory receptor n=1 Tax=Pteropus alecto TaxID=9402 RepID=L5L327_PTEAL|nr:Olfactory receptor 2K2 [Pteropus alecto]